MRRSPFVFFGWFHLMTNLFHLAIFLFHLAISLFCFGDRRKGIVDRGEGGGLRVAGCGCEGK